MKGFIPALCIPLLLIIKASLFGELPDPKYWPERIIIEQDTIGQSENGEITVRKGSSFVLIRAEEDQLVLSGRINAVKVPIIATDFIPRTQANEASENVSDRGLVNGLLVGRLRYLGAESFHPVQVKDSDLYEQFLFVYLEPGQPCNDSLINKLKELHAECFAEDASKVMVMFADEPSPAALFDFVYSQKLPWKSVVYHMAAGYREAFQHGVEAPALVLSDKHGRLLDSEQLAAVASFADIEAAILRVRGLLEE